VTSSMFLIAALFHNALGHLGHLMVRDGYGVLFGFVAAESFSFPLPGEIALLAGAFEASRGRLDLAEVVVVAVAAAVVGDNAAYLAGRHAGRPVLLRFARMIHVHQSQLEKMEHRYDRNVWRAVTTARWISPIRGWAALSAGAARVPWPRFFLANLLGSASWAATVTLASYALVRAFPAEEVENGFDLGANVLIGVVIAAGVVLLVLWLARRRRHGKAGAAATGGGSVRDDGANEVGAPPADRSPTDRQPPAESQEQGRDQDGAR
jgi:membrane protein DedA with SNARE-associated domain